MSPEEICFLSATEMARAVRDKSLSAVEIVDAVLARIDEMNPRLNAYCTSMADSARDAAIRADEQTASGAELGPLHGVPVSIKDNLYVKNSQNNADPFPGQSQRDLQWTQFTYPFNLTGQPAASVPCGWTESNLPIGLQIVGRRFDDALVLRAARVLEQIQPWGDRRPQM